MPNQNFRTALHGFHRDDVVQFIENNTLNHERELRAKNEEITRLHDQIQELEGRLAQSEQETAQLRQALEDVKKPAAPNDAQPPLHVLREKELAAYRRAELAERRANARVAALYKQVQAIFDENQAGLAETNQLLDTLSKSIQSDIRQLQTVLDETSVGYTQTANSLRAVSRSVSEDPASE